MEKIKTDVFILGGGSAGIGCLYRLIKNGISAVICDKNSGFGGTSVFSGVSCWEPGVSLYGIHETLAKELMKKGAYVAKSIPNNDFEKQPWALSVKDENGKYSDTLKRCNMFFSDRQKEMRRFQFDGEDFNGALNTILKDYRKNFIAFFETSLKDVKTENGRIISCVLSNGTEIEAKYFVDCGGTAVPLIRMCGCKTAFGGQNDKFGEPSAIKQSGGINGVTYVFRLKKTQDKNHIDDPDTPIDYSLLNPVPVSCFNTYPNGDINVNMLPTMQGDEYFRLGKDADEYGHRLVRNYVNFLAREKGLTGYTLSKIFKAGVREGYTLRGKHVLTENDIRKGVFSQENQSHFIAVGDHMLDVHGAGGLARELDIPYGIPVECCMTNEYENLFAAGTGASFSHIASSTVRLSRTMMSLGEGLGEYLSQKVLYKTVDFSKIQESQKFHETTEKWK